MAVSRRPASTRAISRTVVPLSSPTASPSAIRPATSLAMRFFVSRASSSLMANGNSSPRIIRLTAPPRTRRATPRSTRTSRSRRTVISAVPNSAAAVATSIRPCSRSASTSWLIRAAASMILNLHHSCSFAQNYCAYDFLRRSVRTTCRSGRSRPVLLIRPGQAEHVLGEVVEDHLLRDRGDAHQPRLAPVALDVVLLRVSEPAVGLQRRVGGLEAGLGGEELGQVGLLPRGQAVVDAPGRLPDDEFGSAEPRVCLGERERDALVLADRAAEYGPALA